MVQRLLTMLIAIAIAVVSTNATSYPDTDVAADTTVEVVEELESDPCALVLDARSDAPRRGISIASGELAQLRRAPSTPPPVPPPEG